MQVRELQGANLAVDEALADAHIQLFQVGLGVSRGEGVLWCDQEPGPCRYEWTGSVQQLHTQRATGQGCPVACMAA
jgi:hypothetical protein